MPQILTPDEIHNRYHYHASTPAARVMHDHFNTLLENVAEDIEKNVPDGRAKALAHTKLEETKMWVNAAIAQNHDKL